jgi:proline iminopeptidase
MRRVSPLTLWTWKPPYYAVQYRECAPQAEFVMFERSGHVPFVEEQDKALAVLRAFLAR